MPSIIQLTVVGCSGYQNKRKKTIIIQNHTCKKWNEMKYQLFGATLLDNNFVHYLAANSVWSSGRVTWRPPAVKGFDINTAPGAAVMNQQIKGFVLPYGPLWRGLDLLRYLRQLHHSQREHKAPAGLWGKEGELHGTLANVSGTWHSQYQNSMHGLWVNGERFLSESGSTKAMSSILTKANHKPCGSAGQNCNPIHPNSTTNLNIWQN